MSDNQLQVIVQESGLDSTKADILLNRFRDFFDIASEWEKKAEKIIVTDASHKDQMKEARMGRLFLREKRISLEKTRKELKEQSLRESKAIDGIANILKALIVPLEKYLESQENFVEIEAQKVATIERKRLEDEAEKKRLAEEEEAKAERKRIKAENDRLLKEAEENKRLLEEERAKADKERLKLEAEKRKQEDEAAAALKLEKEKADKAQAEVERLEALKLKEETERVAQLEVVEETQATEIECPHCHKTFALYQETIQT